MRITSASVTQEGDFLISPSRRESRACVVHRYRLNARGVDRGVRLKVRHADRAGGLHCGVHGARHRASRRRSGDSESDHVSIGRPRIAENTGYSGDRFGPNAVQSQSLNVPRRTGRRRNVPDSGAGTLGARWSGLRGLHVEDDHPGPTRHGDAGVGVRLET